MEQADEELARLLQEQEYKVTQESLTGTAFTAASSRVDENDDFGADLLDIDAPFKDLHGLFLAFNDQYFESKLSACEVRWSPRMTRCAGLCLYQSKSQYCSIRLSEPLLKFRPESDYIDTLLHEMIHAYLFVTKAIQDHDGHGPDFQYHMNRINAEAQTTITVYHTFHDEVAHYQTHIWKCNGPCQYRPPYYGIVKRSMNRPPQPADRWYAEHQSTCGGTYTKISEPEPSKKKSSKSAKNAKQDTAIPRARTLLDDFLSGSKPIAKPSTLSSTTETGAVANKLLRSKLPSLNSTIDEKSNGIKIESNGTITTIEDAKFPASTTSGNIPDSQDTTQDGKNSAEQQRPSAREAAAAAAMARFEQHLKLQGHDASLAKDIVVPVTKRRDPGLASVSEVDSAQNWNKKIKTEHTRRGDSDTSPPGVKREIEKEQEEEEYNTVESDLATMTLVQCPVCSNHVEEATINDHVDLCIWRTSGGAD